MSMKTETNLSDNYRKSIIILLSRFSVFFKNQKSFKSMTREDILSFLDSFRKIESVDPMHIVDWNIQHIQNLPNEILQMAIFPRYRTG